MILFHALSRGPINWSTSRDTSIGFMDANMYIRTQAELFQLFVSYNLIREIQHFRFALFQFRKLSRIEPTDGAFTRDATCSLYWKLFLLWPPWQLPKKTIRCHCFIYWSYKKICTCSRIIFLSVGIVLCVQNFLLVNATSRWSEMLSLARQPWFDESHIAPTLSFHEQRPALTSSLDQDDPNI